MWAIFFGGPRNPIFGLGLVNPSNPSNFWSKKRGSDCSDWPIRAQKLKKGGLGWTAFLLRNVFKETKQTKIISGKKNDGKNDWNYHHCLWSGIGETPKNVLHYYTSVKWIFPFSLWRQIFRSKMVEIISRKNCLLISFFLGGGRKTIIFPINCPKTAQKMAQIASRLSPQKLSNYRFCFHRFSLQLLIKMGATFGNLVCSETPQTVSKRTKISR